MNARRRLLALVLVAAPLAAAGERLEIAPGLVLRDLSRGAPATAERFRVVAGRFESQREADAMLARLRAAGEAPSVRYAGGYEVSVAELPDRAAAEAVTERLRAAGFEDELETVAYGQDVLHAGGPWRIHLLEADPRRVRVDVAHARDAVLGVETTLETARRLGAAAAVNGGFYVVGGAFAGDATGLQIVDGELWSEPDRGRGALGFDRRDGVEDALFGRVGLAARLAVEGAAPIEVDGLNRARGDDEVIVYTPAFHRTTLTGGGGIEIAVDGGAVVDVRPAIGSARIPPGGFVVSFGPRAAAEAAALEAGSRVRLETAFRSTLGDPGAAWAGADDATSAGPLLVVGGEAVEEWSDESISRVFCEARHPRTAVGERADGTLLFVVVDGRQRETSVGMSCGELARLFLELGAVDAVNLDGGGSTTMVAGGRVVNSPSDPRGERANGDAVLLFPLPHGGTE
jgi:hypothetical protein